MLRRAATPLRGLAALSLLTATVVGPLALAAQAADPPYGTASNNTPAPCPAGTADCPTQDLFFSAPGNLASLADGTVIRSRTATIQVASPTIGAAYTIVYRSEDSFGAPVVDSATVLLPATPSTTGAHLVSWQFPEDSVGAQCRPSYDLAHTGTNGNVDAEQGTIDALLGQGITVVAPDFEGPAEDYEIGPQSGHAVLDGIRAAEGFTPAGLTASTPVELNGYSGGSYATGWGAELAHGYAPALNIVGASMGGTPADQRVVGHYLDGTAFVGLALLTTIALDRAYPALHVQDYLNDTGKQFATDNQASCVGSAATAYAFQRFDAYTKAPGFIDSPAISSTLAHDSLGQSPPAFPVFNYHVYNDEIVPYVQDQVLVKTYCTAGTPVQHVVIAGDHISGEAIATPAVVSFIQARLNAVPFVSDCAAILATPLLPQVPPITNPGSSSPAANLPEAPAAALLGVVGLAAGALVLRRRGTALR